MGVGNCGNNLLSISLWRKTKSTRLFGSYRKIWNGTSWTEVADLATGRINPGGCGSELAGICYGGDTSTAPSGATEEWNDPVLCNQNRDSKLKMNYNEF